MLKEVLLKHQSGLQPRGTDVRQYGHFLQVPICFEQIVYNYTVARLILQNLDQIAAARTSSYLLQIILTIPLIIDVIVLDPFVVLKHLSFPSTKSGAVKYRHMSSNTTILQYGGISIKDYNLLEKAIRTLVPQWVDDPNINATGFSMANASNNRNDDSVFIAHGTPVEQHHSMGFQSFGSQNGDIDKKLYDQNQQNRVVSIFDDRQLSSSQTSTPTGSQRLRVSSNHPNISLQSQMATDLEKYAPKRYNNGSFDYNGNQNGYNGVSDSQYPLARDVVENVIPETVSSVSASTLQWFVSIILLLMWSPIVLAAFVRGCFYISSYYYNMTISSGLAGIEASYYDRIVVAVWGLSLMSMSYGFTKFMMDLGEMYASYVQRSSNSYKPLDNDNVKMSNSETVLGMSVYDMITNVFSWIKGNLSVWKIISTSAWSVHKTCERVAFILFWMTFGGVVLIMVRNLVGVPYTFFPGYDSQLIGPLIRVFNQLLDPAQVVSGQINAFWNGFANQL